MFMDNIAMLCNRDNKPKSTKKLCSKLVSSSSNKAVCLLWSVLFCKFQTSSFTGPFPTTLHVSLRSVHYQTLCKTTNTHIYKYAQKNYVYFYIYLHSMLPDVLTIQ